MWTTEVEDFLCGQLHVDINKFVSSLFVYCFLNGYAGAVCFGDRVCKKRAALLHVWDAVTLE